MFTCRTEESLRFVFFFIVYFIVQNDEALIYFIQYPLFHVSVINKKNHTFSFILCLTDYFYFPLVHSCGFIIIFLLNNVHIMMMMMVALTWYSP